jgi:hypothetical protein
VSSGEVCRLCWFFAKYSEYDVGLAAYAAARKATASGEANAEDQYVNQAAQHMPSLPDSPARAVVLNYTLR